ncbi:MAG TPA: hypothetical protein VGK25_12165, partial [Ignavibacteria bacterium]
MKKRITAFVLSLFLLSIISSGSYSYPKFAALYGEKCSNCHVNPTGGGMRKPGAMKFARKTLFFRFLKQANASTNIETQISQGISVGGDMRMLFVDNQVGENLPHFNSFFQMQGDLYLNAEVNDYISVMIAPGLYIPGNNIPNNPLATKYEIYGLISGIPAGIYLKVGRFIPNFGIKLPEHRAYNRQFNDFYTPYASDAGFELGISPDFGNGSLTLTAGVSNGSSTNAAGQTNNNFDFDTQRQFTGSLDFRWQGKKRKWGLGLGGSFINNPFKYDPANGTDAIRKVAAGYVAGGFMERVAIMGEWTYNRLDIANATSTRFDQRTLFGEIDIRIIDGLDLKGQYELYDNLANEILNRRRYSFGVDMFPLTGLEIESIVRLVKEPNGSDI